MSLPGESLAQVCDQFMVFDLRFENERLRRVIDDLVMASIDSYGCLNQEQAYSAVERLYNSMTPEDHARIEKLWLEDGPTPYHDA